MPTIGITLTVIIVVILSSFTVGFGGGKKGGIIFGEDRNPTSGALLPNTGHEFVSEFDSNSKNGGWV